MPKEPIEIVPMYEQTEHDWNQYLDEFDEKVWPIFKSRGYDKGDAHIIWYLSKVTGEIEALREELVEGV